MPSTSSFLRQLSGREPWRSTSSRWGISTIATNKKLYRSVEGGGKWGSEASFNQMKGLHDMYGNEIMRKRVMVVVDHTSDSKHATMWALTHVANKGDLLTLLHIRQSGSGSDSSPYFINSLGSLCKACKPEVEVEPLVIQGPRLATVLNQVKKLDVSVLVLGQKKTFPLINCFCGTSRSEEFVEQCINDAECLTIGVNKQSGGVGGYLISTRRKKNFWLLA